MLRYDEAEGPTKADNGDSDDTVIYRESDINGKSDKESGWTNPLSWTDDGTGDDMILDMHFKPLDEPYKKFTPPDYEIDEDIVDSMNNEKEAEETVKQN